MMFTVNGLSLCGICDRGNRSKCCEEKNEAVHNNMESKTEDLIL